MDQIHVGISGEEEWPRLAAWAVLVEEMGFDSIWAGEHFTNWRPALSAIPVVATFSAVTSRIKVGTSIILFPLRHPTVVAKEVSTLDILSKGRVILGIGVGGENPKEFEACGVDVKERGARTNEGLKLVRNLWTKDEVTHKGRFFNMEGISMLPKSVQKPHPPIYVAGRRDAAMRRAARYGDGWFPYLYDPERYRTSVTKIKEVAEESGKGLSTFEWALYQYVAIEESYEEALTVAARSLGTAYKQDFTTIAAKYVVLGTPSQCLERLHQFYEAGARHFVLAPLGSAEGRAKRMEIIATELMPQIRRFS